MKRILFLLLFTAAAGTVHSESAQKQPSEEASDETKEVERIRKRYAPRKLGAPAYLDESHPDHLALRKRRAMAQSGEIDPAIYLPIKGETEEELKQDRDRALTELKEDYTFAIKHSNLSGKNLRMELAAASSFLKSRYAKALEELEKKSPKSKAKTEAKAQAKAKSQKANKIKRK